MQKILLSFLLVAAHLAGNAQSRLVLNGGIITMSNSAYLVVDNPATNAITRNSGHIISEGENNIVRWNIANTTGTYTVPFGYGSSNYLPLSFVKTAGTGAGYFLFSTYHTGWQNSANLPAGITSFNGATGDNSAYVLDRFWQVNAKGYKTKPDISNLVMTYLDGEYTATGNTIAETGLKGQRWNSTTNSWSDMGATGVVNTTANTVTISSVTASNLYPWWVLVDQASTLPLNFLSFDVKRDDKDVELKWSTSGEVNVSGFTIERSTDGRHFVSIGTVPATDAQGTNIYRYIDTDPAAGTNFYRIKETDTDASYSYSVIRNLLIDGNSFLRIYPNPSTDARVYVDLKTLPADRYNVSLFEVSGALIYSYRSQPEQRLIPLDLGGRVRKGVYFINITAAGFTARQKIFIL